MNKQLEFSGRKARMQGGEGGGKGARGRVNMIDQSAAWQCAGYKSCSHKDNAVLADHVQRDVAFWPGLPVKV